MFVHVQREGIVRNLFSNYFRAVTKLMIGNIYIFQIRPDQSQMIYIGPYIYFQILPDQSQLYIFFKSGRINHKGLIGLYIFSNLA